MIDTVHAGPGMSTPAGCAACGQPTPYTWCPAHTAPAPDFEAAAGTAEHPHIPTLA